MAKDMTKDTSPTTATQPAKATATAPPASPRKPPVATPAASSSSKATSKSKTTRLLSLSALVVLAAALIGASQDDVLSHLPYPVAASVSRALNAATGKGAIIGNFRMPDKYHTDLVAIAPRELVSTAPDACPAATTGDYVPRVLGTGALVHVQHAMNDTALHSATTQLFVLLNGRNDGLYVAWNGDVACLGAAAQYAAIALGADTDVVANGVRLFSQLGYPVTTAAELHATRNIVHVLLDFQLWQWPGITKGYVYHLPDGVTLTTVGLRPKVFDVTGAFSAADAKQIMALGQSSLDRSRVDGSNSSKVVSGSRTSHTAFLDDGAFTRDFRHRSAAIVRLPSAAYAERLQLVRYAAGEFYRQHLDTFHSREFLPKGSGEYTFEDYETWATWAAAKLRTLSTSDSDSESTLPAEFQEGGALFPDPADDRVFPNALLRTFHASMTASNMFTALFDADWATWIQENVDKNAAGLLPVLLAADNRRKYLPWIIQAWEDKLGRPGVHYTLPKKPVHGVSHLFYWIRWVKERIAYMGSNAPALAQPSGELYPKFTVAFQEQLLGFVLDDYSESVLTRLTTAEWYAWMVENRGRNHVLVGVLEAFPTVLELAIQSWESRVRADINDAPQLHYTKPTYVKHFHPQRFVTLFLYLTNETKVGGETVFPFSLDRYSDEPIERTGMDECSTGLAVPPRGLHASLFYVQTPEGDTDEMSRHGGCPPHDGIKWGANSFMWDSDADEGADLWTTK